MGTLKTMAGSYCRWIGSPTGLDHSGRMLAALPAAQIVAASKGTGDRPWMWCPATVMNGNGRGKKNCIADYVPNLYPSEERSFNVQPGYFDYNDNRYGLGYSTPTGTNIYLAAMEKMGQKLAGGYEYIDGTNLYKWYVRQPSSFCEKLAYISGVPGDNFKVIGWFKPGRPVYRIPPGMHLAGRIPGPNINQALMFWEGDELYSGINQDFQMATSAPSGDGRTLIVPTVPGIGYTGTGHNDYIGGDYFGAWCPSMRNWHSDFVPTSAGENVYLQDYTEVYEKVNKVWQHVDTVYGGDVTYSSGGYDWRYLNAFISRYTWTRPNATQRHRTRNWIGPMYWKVSDGIVNEDPPNGLEVVSRLFALMCSEFYESNTTETRYAECFPPDTLFDAKVQAHVWSMRCSPAMADYLESLEYNVIRMWETATCVRVWCCTDVRVHAKQAMPMPLYRYEFPMRKQPGEFGG